VGTYRILQPGSSVACSLSKGESSTAPKHMSFFEIKDRKFRLKPIKYYQMRQFLYDEISLKDFPELQNSGSKVEEIMKKVIYNKIMSMVREARSNLTETENPEDDSQLPLVKCKILEPSKVLIRLKVDYEGFTAINHQRFGSQFVGEVANAGDILLMTKKRKDPGIKGAKELTTTVQGELRQLLAEGEEDEINRIRIEDLVNETLANSKHSLSILSEGEMAQVIGSILRAVLFLF
jgi:hypothetical protein